MKSSFSDKSKAQTSRAAIERIYIAMRHLFIRGGYKPMGMSGEAILEALRTLNPEIYGSINDPERVELDGLLYIFERLPKGIEECRYLKLIAKEGYESDFNAIIPDKRRRNSYRIDKEQMFVEVTRGRSDVYDILTHLTFMFNESEKIRTNALDHRNRITREWHMLEKIVLANEKFEAIDLEVAFTYLSTLLGRTFKETKIAATKFENADGVHSLFHIVYWLGKRAIEEFEDGINDREISFSSSLREKIGLHIHGELWAENIKALLFKKALIQRPIYIISANTHSVMNSLFAYQAVGKQMKTKNLEKIALKLSDDKEKKYNGLIKKYALSNGMFELEDKSGTNIPVQIFDCEQIKDYPFFEGIDTNKSDIIIVMDYAFGEQAYETMDELLKPFVQEGTIHKLNVKSINIMGKAGILCGDKGDIMLANAHVFEGTADNYPFTNDLKINDFKNNGIDVYEGTMITVLGTSLQNKEVLKFFERSSWNAIGLEMEGAHYQKAIQSASKIRKSIDPKVKTRYAYYASDNPIKTGSTLASGSLGLVGVKPTYLITKVFLEYILGLEKAN